MAIRDTMNTSEGQRRFRGPFKRLLAAHIAALAPMLMAGAAETIVHDDLWNIDSNTQWIAAKAEVSNITIAQGRVLPTASRAHFVSVVKRFGQRRRAKELVLEQIPQWGNWTSKPGIGPDGGADAAVFIVAGEGDYWYLNATRSGGVYGAWHSTDMQSWSHYPEVIGEDWVTTAEYADGKFYIYYDEPNDEDPHLIIDDDLTDAKHQDLGEVFADPSHGSDAGVIRDEDGSFHLIYEDWDPLNARKHSWDSPLAGHADSPDGIHGFEPHEFPPPIDKRGKPTGETGTYVHGTTGETYVYQIHKGPQNAYGDYTLIKVGRYYHIFCDYHPHDGRIRLGHWYSKSLRTQFQWGGEIGEGFHPDPTIGFAEGEFYLFVQRKENMVSPGPWAGQVAARAGVDTDGDGSINQWTDWQIVREHYSLKPGFSRIVEAVPAALDLSALPSGIGFQFEFKIESATGSDANPIMDRVMWSFE